MLPHSESAKKLFGFWEYDSYEEYLEIGARVRGGQEHISRIMNWYAEQGGRDNVYKEYIVEVKNVNTFSTLTQL